MFDKNKKTSKQIFFSFFRKKRFCSSSIFVFPGKREWWSILCHTWWVRYIKLVIYSTIYFILWANVVDNILVCLAFFILRTRQLNDAISGEGLHIYTFTLHLWPLSSEGLYLVTPTMTLLSILLSFSRIRCTHTCFNDLILSQ